MSDNAKHFDAYIVTSTFARAIVDVFIPVMMYNGGYPLRYCLLYYMVMNLVSLLISYPLAYVAKRFGNRQVAVISIIFFVALQFLLLNLDGSLWRLYTISIVYAFYKRCYWMSRRFYTLHIIHKKQIGKVYAIISILHQLSVMAATYIGAILLDGLNQKLLIVISTGILLLSMIPLFRMDLKHEKNITKLNMRETLAKIPPADMIHFGIYELWNVLKFIFPIYIAVYVKDTYQTVGIVAVITDFAIIIFSYLFGKKLDGSKKDFLQMSILLVVITYLLKANAGYVAIMFVSFLEGFTTKMFEISFNRNSHVLSKKFEYNNYNLAYELAENFIRLLASVLLFVLPFGLRGDIYVVCGLMLCGCLIKFKIPKISEYDAESNMLKEED